MIGPLNHGLCIQQSPQLFFATKRHWPIWNAEILLVRSVIQGRVSWNHTAQVCGILAGNRRGTRYYTLLCFKANHFVSTPDRIANNTLSNGFRKNVIHLEITFELFWSFKTTHILVFVLWVILVATIFAVYYIKEFVELTGSYPAAPVWCVSFHRRARVDRFYWSRGFMNYWMRAPLLVRRAWVCNLKSGLQFRTGLWNIL